MKENIDQKKDDDYQIYIEELRSQHPAFYFLVGMASGAILLLLLINSKYFTEAFWASLRPEVIGIIFTTLVIDNLARQRGRLQRRGELIISLGHGSNASAIQAAEELRAKGWLEKDYLYGIDLSEASLKNINLSRARLHDVKLVGADLESANLQGTDLSGADLREANLRFANLTDAVLNRVILLGAQFASGKEPEGGPDLSQEDLVTPQGRDYIRKTELKGARLQQIDFRDVIIEDMDFTGCDLRESNFTDMTLSTVIFKEADLRGAKLEGADFTIAQLQGANLLEMDLTQVKTFAGAQLSRAKMQRTNLTGVNLVGANLSAADLSGANLAGANLRDAILENTIFDAQTVFDAQTTLPNGDKWIPATDITQFTIPTVFARWDERTPATDITKEEVKGEEVIKSLI
jgi:uncharacterized protein YjbI with pentapeptide repeats